jgi:hypothetical protein
MNAIFITFSLADVRLAVRRRLIVNLDAVSGFSGIRLLGGHRDPFSERVTRPEPSPAKRSPTRFHFVAHGRRFPSDPPASAARRWARPNHAIGALSHAGQTRLILLPAPNPFR